MGFCTFMFVHKYKDECGCVTVCLYVHVLCLRNYIGYAAWLFDAIVMLEI